MKPELALAALSFLARVDIKGAEAPLLVQIAGVLEQFASSKQVAPDTGARPKLPPRG